MEMEILHHPQLVTYSLHSLDSVLTAWAAGKFSADLIAMFVKKSGIEDKVKHRSIIIPGYLASIKGELEEELPDWTIQIGPREASHLPPFLKNWKPE